MPVLSKSLASYLAAFVGWLTMYFVYAVYSRFSTGVHHVSEFGVFFWGGLLFASVLWAVFLIAHSGRFGDRAAKRVAALSLIAIWFLVGGCYTAAAAVLYFPIFAGSGLIAVALYLVLTRFSTGRVPKPAAYALRALLYAVPILAVTALVTVVPVHYPGFGTRYLGGEPYRTAVNSAFKRIEAGDSVERVRSLIPDAGRSSVEPDASFSWSYGSDSADESVSYYLRVEEGRVSEASVTRQPKDSQSSVP